MLCIGIPPLSACLYVRTVMPLQPIQRPYFLCCPVRPPTSGQVVHVVLGTLTVTPSEAQPAGKEAQRILTFFMSSLSNKQLEKPPPLVGAHIG